ncbi:hypothetical protein QBC46DRAFT_216230, partial [Diplogelasinospora grovesii]
GRFVPSTAVGARFSSDSFVDSTGNPLDQASLSDFVGAVNNVFRDAGDDVTFNEQNLFDLLVICSLTARGGERILLKGTNPSQLEFADQLSVNSYQCCIDYNANNC